MERTMRRRGSSPLVHLWETVKGEICVLDEYVHNRHLWRWKSKVCHFQKEFRQRCRHVSMIRKLRRGQRDGSRKARSEGGVKGDGWTEAGGMMGQSRGVGRGQSSPEPPRSTWPTPAHPRGCAQCTRRRSISRRESLSSQPSRKAWEEVGGLGGNLVPPASFRHEDEHAWLLRALELAPALFPPLVVDPAASQGKSVCQYRRSSQKAKELSPCTHKTVTSAAGGCSLGLADTADAGAHVTSMRCMISCSVTRGSGTHSLMAHASVKRSWCPEASPPDIGARFLNASGMGIVGSWLPAERGAALSTPQALAHPGEAPKQPPATPPAPGVQNFPQKGLEGDIRKLGGGGKRGDAPRFLRKVGGSNMLPLSVPAASPVVLRDMLNMVSPPPPKC